jgi:hypothetical protein
LDDRDTGLLTNNTLNNIQPGTHVIKLVKQGYLDKQQNVTVVAGQTAQLSVTLDPIPSFVTTPPDQIIIVENAQNTLNVKLSAAPPQNVSVTATIVSGGDPDISIVSGDSFTITTADWKQNHPVILAAKADADLVNGTATIRIHSTNYTAMQDLDVTATEQDTSNLGILSVSSGDYTATGKFGGLFYPATKTYRLQNTGQASIRWTVSVANSSTNWINLNGTSGELGIGQYYDLIVSINSNAGMLSVGVYTDEISFVNTTNGNGNTTRAVILNVNAVQKYILAVTRGNGIDGSPIPGNYSYNEGELVNYYYTLQANYKDLIVTVDGANAPETGTISMNTNHTLTASATLNDLPPTISIDNPANGDIVYGTVNITGVANDDYGLNNIEIYIDGTMSTKILTSTKPYNYSYPWNSTGVTDGAHTILVIAYDNNSQSTQTNISVTVKNNEMIVQPATGLTSSGSAGAFNPSSIQYTIINPFSTSIQWSVTNTANWLTISPVASGTLNAGSSTTVTISINTNANSLTTGQHGDTITFTNTTNGQGNTFRTVALTVN